MLPLLAPDTETHLIAPGLAAPPHVCTAIADSPDHAELYATPEAKGVWREALKLAVKGKAVLSNVNMAYDMSVVLAKWPDLADLVFRAYESGNVRCSIIDQRLIDISNGVLESKTRPKSTRYYSAKALALRLLGVELDKGEDTWQLRYAELDGLPVEAYPAAARKYPKLDAKVAYAIALHQYTNNGHLLRDSGAQAFASFVLYLQTCRGIRTDGKACRRLIKRLEAGIEDAEATLWDEGLLTRAKSGKVTKNLNVARKRLRRTLPRQIRAKLDEAIQEAKAFAAKQARDSRQKVQVKHDLSEAELLKCMRRLDKLRAKDISHAELLRRFTEHDNSYSEQLYVDISSLIRKPRPFKALGVELSKTGLVSIKANACRASKDPALIALATFTSANTQRKKAQRLLKGSVIPLQTTYQALINSGRTSSRASEAPLVGDNFQNFARSTIRLPTDKDEELQGMRECIVPRPGFVFCSIDFDAAEMRSYAQIEYEHLGVSELREVLNAGKNPHRVLGAYILGISEKSFERRYANGDEECIRTAQFAKIPNFALLGGGGYKILPDYAAGMGISLDLNEAKELYEAFHARWCHVSEMHKHFKTFIHKVYEHPYSRRLRYIDRYAQACNNPFQGLTADAAKLALCRLARAAYVRGGKLWGSYPVLFLHDEVLFELQREMASEHAYRATDIMVRAYNTFTPDVPMTASPALMSRFVKGAKTVTHETLLDSDGNKKLLIYVPASKAA